MHVATGAGYRLSIIILHCVVLLAECNRIYRHRIIWMNRIRNSGFVIAHCFHRISFVIYFVMSVKGLEYDSTSASTPGGDRRLSLGSRSAWGVVNVQTKRGGSGPLSS